MKVQAKLREASVKAKRLRREGYVPAVIYGPQLEGAVAIAISEQDLNYLFKQVTRSTTVEVEVEGDKSYHTFIKDIQVDPITDRFLHVDFYVPEPGRKLVLSVPVKLVGTAPGVKEGGILEHVHEYIEVEGLPKRIPPYFEVDISSLGLEESILIGDLEWDDELRPLHPLDDPIVTVLAPRAVLVTAAGEEAEGEEAEAGEEGEGAAAEEGETEQG
jgi:large subunit ribosomal protein L25